MTNINRFQIMQSQTRKFLQEIKIKEIDPCFRIVSPYYQNAFPDEGSSLTEGYKNLESKSYSKGLLSGRAIKWEGTNYYLDVDEAPEACLDEPASFSLSENYGYNEKEDIFHIPVDGKDCAIVAAVRYYSSNEDVSDKLKLIKKHFSKKIGYGADLRWVAYKKFIISDYGMNGGVWLNGVRINGHDIYCPTAISTHLLVAQNYEILAKPKTKKIGTQFPSNKT